MKRRSSPRAVRCLESSWRPAFSGDTESVRLETEVGRTETVLSFHTTSCFRDLPFLAPIRRSNALIAGKKGYPLAHFSQSSVLSFDTSPEFSGETETTVISMRHCRGSLSERRFKYQKPSW